MSTAAYLIYNPTAGRIRANPDFVQQCCEGLRCLGYEATPIPTAGPLTAMNIAAKLVQHGATHIFVAGGDGTINEVIQSLVHTPALLGVLPGGTGNVLCSELGYARSLETAFAALKHAEPRPVTTGVVRRQASPPRYFICMAGCGFDAEVVYTLPQQSKAQLGKLAYWLHGFTFVGKRLPQLQARWNGHSANVTFALISRIRNYGGDLNIARNVTLLDDDFEIVLLEGSVGYQLLKYLAGIITGSLAEIPGATITRACSAQLEPAGSKPARIQVDGEYIGKLPAVVEAVPKSLRLLIPMAYIHSCAS